ncbi:hypothetical protein GW17_00020731, partial [Ensete ventricosum]
MEPNDGTFVLHSELEKVTVQALRTTRDKLRASRSAISTADIADDFTVGVPGEAFEFSQCRNKGDGGRVIWADRRGLSGRAIHQRVIMASLLNLVMD